MYVAQVDIKPITAKPHLLKHWKEYDLVDTKEEFIALLNILQACDENLSSLHNAGLGETDEFCDMYGRWDGDRDVVKALNQHACFFTEKEFIDFILERWQEYNDDGDDGTEYIRQMTSDAAEDFADTQISKTDDGYVVRVWC